MWDNIYQPDQTGSEGGLIISDEEYKDSCRITLEKCERYYAITCGIYGGMMHTVFCNSTQYQETYNNMKKDLQEFNFLMPVRISTGITKSIFTM